MILTKVLKFGVQNWRRGFSKYEEAVAENEAKTIGKGDKMSWLAIKKRESKTLPDILDKVFKSGLSNFGGRQPLKNLLCPPFKI